MRRRETAIIAGGIIRGAAIALLLGVAGCDGLDLRDNPGHEFPKQTGPLTVPPKSLQNGATP